MRQVLSLLTWICLSPLVGSFNVLSRQQNRYKNGALNSLPEDVDIETCARRAFLANASIMATTSFALTNPNTANAAVGSLPEYADSNAILQGVSIKVSDKSQQDAMVKFLVDGFQCRVLRQRITGSVEETWLGFGPEQLSVPSDFVLPVSSFAKYGGHASIRLVCDSKATSVLYRKGNPAPGDNLAFLQLSVPEYRISQMVLNEGNILDAYGIVNVVSPVGLPMRGIVGIWPDPIMFVAVNCANIQASKAFYEQLGFVERDYPYSRPGRGTGLFEPAQPPKSVFMSPSANGMGILLLPAKKKPTPNPVVDSLNVVYTASDGGSTDSSVTMVTDPNGIPIAFQPVTQFEAEEKITR